MPRHVRKGDSVIVTAGNDRGVVGEVLRVIPKNDRVVVQGVNVRAKHLKPTQANPQGGIVRREMPIHISNVSPVVEGSPTRVGFEVRPDGSKVRVAARDGRELHTLRKGGRGAPAAAGTRKPRRSRKSTRKTGRSRGGAETTSKTEPKR